MSDFKDDPEFQAMMSAMTQAMTEEIAKATGRQLVVAERQAAAWERIAAALDRLATMSEKRGYGR